MERLIVFSVIFQDILYDLYRYPYLLFFAVFTIADKSEILRILLNYFSSQNQPAQPADKKLSLRLHWKSYRIPQSLLLSNQDAVRTWITGLSQWFNQALDLWEKQPWSNCFIASRIGLRGLIYLPKNPHRFND